MPAELGAIISHMPPDRNARASGQEEGPLVWVRPPHDRGGAPARGTRRHRWREGWFL